MKIIKIFFTILFFVIIGLFVYIFTKAYFYYYSNSYSNISINGTQIPNEFLEGLDLDNEMDKTILKTIYIEGYQNKKEIFFESIVLVISDIIDDPKLSRILDTQGLGQILLSDFMNILNQGNYFDKNIFDTIKNDNIKKCIMKKDNFVYSDINDYICIKKFINNLEGTRVATQIFFEYNSNIIDLFYNNISDNFENNKSPFVLANIYNTGLPRQYIGGVQYLISSLVDRDIKYDGHRSSIDINDIKEIFEKNNIDFDKDRVSNDLSKVEFVKFFNSETIRRLVKVYIKKYNQKPNLFLDQESCKSLKTFLCKRGNDLLLINL